LKKGRGILGTGVVIEQLAPMALGSLYMDWRNYCAKSRNEIPATSSSEIYF